MRDSRLLSTIRPTRDNSSSISSAGIDFTDRAWASTFTSLQLVLRCRRFAREFAQLHFLTVKFNLETRPLIYAQRLSLGENSTLLWSVPYSVDTAFSHNDYCFCTFRAIQLAPRGGKYIASQGWARYQEILYSTHLSSILHPRTPNLMGGATLPHLITEPIAWG